MKQNQGLTLNTQIPQEKPSVTVEDEGPVEEVISLSPAVRQPLQYARRSRASTLMRVDINDEGTALDSIVESGDKRYFGQNVDEADLVAVNLENAFDRL